MAISLFVLGVALFAFGYHNVDLMFNAANMDLDVVDVNFVGTVQTVMEGYLNGIAMMYFSLMFFIIGFLLLLSNDITFKKERL